METVENVKASEVLPKCDFRDSNRKLAGARVFHMKPGSRSGGGRYQAPICPGRVNGARLARPRLGLQPC